MFDYEIIFNNANTFFVKKILFNEVDPHEKKYFWVQYIPFIHLEKKYFPYDRNKNTMWFMDYTQWSIYYSAAFFWWNICQRKAGCDQTQPQILWPCA